MDTTLSIIPSSANDTNYTLQLKTWQQIDIPDNLLTVVDIQEGDYVEVTIRKLKVTKK